MYWPLGDAPPGNSVIILLIFISCYRYSSDDPLWQEVAKRYQQIIEKECKLLGQFPVHYDGQMILQTTPLTMTVNTASRLKAGTANKDRHHARGQEKGASKCKLTEKGTETGNISINEYAYTSIVTENTEDDNLPKIVEVYSLNSQNLPNDVTANHKTNGQEYDRKRNNQGVFSCSNEGTSKMNGHVSTAETSKNVVFQDSKPCTSSRTKPYLVSDNFIDLTISDEEETKACTVHDGATSIVERCSEENVNADNQSEFDQPKEDKSDNGREKKSSQRKRKGVFGNRRKGKRRRLTQNQQRTSKKSPNTGCVKSACNSNNFLDNETDENSCVNNHENNSHDKCKQSLNDQNNNDWRKEEKLNKNTKENIDERKEYWSCSGVNGGVNIPLDMTYRENKITTLKARLAKQEEELAKLRTQKEGKLEKDRSLEAPLQDVGQKQKEPDTNNLSIQGHDAKEEADPGEVNLDDICRHVIKSFDIFNARQGKGKASRKEGIHTLYEKDTCTTKQANSRKSDLNDLRYLQQGSQDEFLFQVGLRRSLYDT